jgi:hypothetical protein
MKLNFIKTIDIMCSTFNVVWDKTTDAGSYSWMDSEIRIGIKHYKKDPLYTFAVINHEVMELILGIMGARFQNGRTSDNYLFNFDHQTFENAIQVHSQTIAKFIKQSKSTNNVN